LLNIDAGAQTALNRYGPPVRLAGRAAVRDRHAIGRQKSTQRSRNAGSLEP